MNATQFDESAAIPDHVPAELVHTLGLTDGPEFLAAPHAFMAALHDRLPPIVFSPSRIARAAWQITSYEAALCVLRHPKIFSTAGTGPFPRDPDDYFKIIPVEIDPPEHRLYRAILDPIFSPKGVAQLESKIRSLANQLIDSFIDKRECEFAKDLGRPLPVYVFLDLMGLPKDMMDTFIGWALGLLHCMGAHLARLEIKICISEFLRRIPEFRVKKGTTIEYLPGAVVGPKTVPLTW